MVMKAVSKKRKEMVTETLRKRRKRRKERRKKDSNKGCENTNNKLDEILKILRDKETPSTTQSE